MADLGIRRIEGRAIVVRGNDIDTDRIIPARFLKALTFSELGEYPFYDERFDPEGREREHPFNRGSARGARILLVNANFGCGSSREHAPQCLKRWGIDAVVGHLLRRDLRRQLRDDRSSRHPRGGASDGEAAGGGGSRFRVGVLRGPRAHGGPRRQPESLHRNAGEPPARAPPTGTGTAPASSWRTRRGCARSTSACPIRGIPSGVAASRYARFACRPNGRLHIAS